MLVLGEVRGAILVVETDSRCFCLKCKKKTGITKEVYKAKNTKVVIEKGNCRECGTKNRSFRKFTAFSSENYKRHRYFGLYSTKRYSKMRWSELMAPTTNLTTDYIMAAKHRCSPPKLMKAKMETQSSWWTATKHKDGSIQSSISNPPMQQQRPYGTPRHNQYPPRMRDLAGAYK